MYKLITSKDINSKLLEQKVVIYGWIQKKTRIGRLFFITLRDSYNFCQIVFDQRQDIKFKNEEISNESFICVKGIVKIKKTSNILSKPKAINYEIVADFLKIINTSSPLPFMIKNDTDGLEKLRLEYRYLDLRRPIMQDKMWTRHDVIKNIRLYFYQNKKFIELETPILSKPTIEGARNFFTQATTNKKSNFALPQSPQLYKQTLMNAGFPAYFQIARCFRDEDLRNNRQPEFTQLDLEMNFANAENIMNLVENLIIFLWKKTKPSSREYKFLKLDYSLAWNKYGSDAPDLRYDLFLENYFELLENKNSDSKIVLKGITFEKTLSDKEWEILQREIQKITNQKLLFYFLKQNKYQTNLNPEQTSILKKISKNNWIGFSGELRKTNLVLGKVRKLLADFFQLTLNQPDAFCWVLNQPMFEFSLTEQRYITTNHPFCQPKDLSVFLKNWKKSKADSYDLVINGEEIGSGSVRVHDLKVQQKIFQILGFDDKKTKTEFGFFLKSMQYGFPHHAGFALGIDRLIQIFTDAKSIRDVIPFPKTTKGTCLFTQKND